MRPPMTRFKVSGRRAKESAQERRLANASDIPARDRDTAPPPSSATAPPGPAKCRRRGVVAARRQNVECIGAAQAERACGGRARGQNARHAARLACAFEGAALRSLGPAQRESRHRITASATGAGMFHLETIEQATRHAQAYVVDHRNSLAPPPTLLKAVHFVRPKVTPPVGFFLRGRRLRHSMTRAALRFIPRILLQEPAAHLS